MSLTPEMNTILRSEIVSDPAMRGYNQADPQATADLLNSSYVVSGTAPTAMSVDVTAADIETVLTPTGEFYLISELAKKPLSAPKPATPEDQSIIAAWNFLRVLTQFQVVKTADPDIWESSQRAMAALIQAGVMSANSRDAITALVVPTPSVPTAEHHARIMEIFIQNPVEFPDTFTSYAVTADDVSEALS